MPITSRKQKRFSSSPLALQKKPSSVRTPSTSRTTALIAVSGADTPQLLEDRDFALVDLLHAVAERGLDQPDVAHQVLDAAGAEGCRLVAAVHRPVEGD